VEDGAVTTCDQTREIIFDNLWYVKFKSGYTLVTTDDVNALGRLYNLVRLCLKVTVGMSPILIQDSDECGCGPLIVGAVPNLNSDNWNSAHGILWIPTSEPDTYVLVQLIIIPEENTIQVIWAGLIFLAMQWGVTDFHKPVFGFMVNSLEGENDYKTH
jgi:hypothetical protein